MFDVTMPTNLPSNQLEAISAQLSAGGIVVMPTDTIYGLVGQALNAQAVERIYAVRKRQPEKPCIILISEIEDLSRFGVAVDRPTEGLLNRLWPGAVSIVLPCTNPEFFYLHRGTNTLAFRMPDNELLRSMLRNTGTLVAPSANLEGQPPAKTIDEAREYFHDQVDGYCDAGRLEGEASTLIEIKEGKVVILRQGAFKVPEGLA